ncbi:MAG: hypothetical protein M1826_000179 [Phylliscum demangeonii]|nr:MAG: hypothetical protein M1826_000179 [Phylliscum demangeonii]
MANLPSHYKAAVIEKKGGSLVIKDVPLQHAKENELLIKVLACGVCHSDSFTSAGVMGNPYPMIPGHEVVGQVVEVGSGPANAKWKVGDRAGGPWHAGHDGVCRECRAGHFQMCEHADVNGLTRNGGYAEYMILRSEAAVRIPADMDPAECAPLLCAGVTVFNSIRHMGAVPGSIVAVQGLGGLGHLAVQCAARMGYRVVAISSGSDKKDFALKLGAHDYVDSSQQKAEDFLQSLGGASLIVSTAPTAKLIEPLIHGLRAYGTLLVLSVVGPLAVDTGVLLGKALSVRSWASGHALDSEETIEFARTHDIHCMVEKFALKDAQKAYDHMMNGKPHFRCVLVMGA